MYKLLALLFFCFYADHLMAADAIISQGKLDKAVFCLYTGVSRVPASRTVNGHPLSGNVTISASDLTSGVLPRGQLPALVPSDVGAAALAGSSTQDFSTAKLLAFGYVSQGTGNASTLLFGRILQFYNVSVGAGYLQVSDDVSTFNSISLTKNQVGLYAQNNLVGSITPSGIDVTGHLSATVGGLTNHGACWKTGGVLGYCSTVITSDGSCTCN
ncbi:hypothetical protein F6V25_08040 [Oryzomonas japonica]|uniref:Uncharacterized protein n=1 Tax=Oryzomonas japonica TaxID=2603858 RepID=A0A7J4ZRC4_9BACT|nr:hypothetical protein [Oryzomonas japonica]KAB0665663.1 hypothetical protein F6V25_08040 [Oryzomonas japonica]